MATDQTIETAPVLRFPLIGRCGDRRVVSAWSLIANDDFGRDLLFGSPWHFNGRYAFKSERITDKPGKHRTVYLHAVVYTKYHGELPSGRQVDHANRDKLDNRPSNLRPVSASHNQVNIGPRKRNTSGYHGVSWMKAANKWIAHVGLQGKLVHLGMYTCILEAARAVNDFYREHYSHVHPPNRV